jgi:hypothetical protein
MRQTIKNKYENGKIYKLINTVDDHIYVGSTTQTLPQRKLRHRRDCVLDPNRPVCFHINNIGGFDKVEIMLVEEFGCNSRNELEARERYWIEQLHPTLNRVIPTRTKKEHYQENREKVLLKQKQYYIDNRDKILQRIHENRDVINEKKKEYRRNNLEKIRDYNKKYREENQDKEKHNITMQTFYINNRDRINEKRKQKVPCECGCIVSKCQLTKHLKTLKHSNLLQLVRPVEDS